MKHRRKIRVTVFVLAGCLFLCSCQLQQSEKLGTVQKIHLIGDDVSTWRDGARGWAIVGKTFLDPKSAKRLATKPGTGVVINGPRGRARDLVSKAEFGDMKAHVEFMISRGSNSGVFIQGQYEIQIYDSWGVTEPEYPGIECGGVYERWDETREPKGYEGYSPRVNTSLPAGQWQSFDIIFRAARFDKEGDKIAHARLEKVLHNRVLIHENLELSGPTRGSMYAQERPIGPVRLQGDHGPVAYRNIWIEPLD